MVYHSLGRTQRTNVEEKSPSKLNSQRTLLFERVGKFWYRILSEEGLRSRKSRPTFLALKMFEDIVVRGGCQFNLVKAQATQAQAESENSGHGENIRVCMGIFTIGFTPFLPRKR